MTTLFLVCAAIGTFVLLVQLVLEFIGLDLPDGDLTGIDLLFGILSIQALSAALAAFGIVGMAVVSAGGSTGLAAVGGMGGAVASMAMVGLLLRSMRKLEHKGNLLLSNAVGAEATVYVPIPAAYGGKGKVQVETQGRTVELEAVTFGPAIATGVRVKVIQLMDGETVEVLAVPQDVQDLSLGAGRGK